MNIKTEWKPGDEIMFRGLARDINKQQVRINEKMIINSVHVAVTTYDSSIIYGFSNETYRANLDEKELVKCVD